MERIAIARPTFNDGIIARPDHPPPPLLSTAIVAYTDVSFSTYLHPHDDQNNNRSTRPDCGTTHNNDANHVSPDDNELSVFDAHKYFSEGNNDHQQRRSNDDGPYDPCRFSSVTSSSSVDGYSSRNYPARFLHATPTASSEASWNSQTGLLSNPPNSFKVSLRNLQITSHTDPDRRIPKSGGGAKWLFRRRCPCIGKKSLQVEDNIVVDPKSPIHFSKVQSPRNFTPDEKVHFQSKNNSDNNSSSQTVQNHSHVIESSQARAHNECATATAAFSFPILPKPSSKIILKNSFLVPPPNAEDEDGEPPRGSLDVFRLPDHSKSRDLHLGSSKVADDDDQASDGSSDLFEIESFSTQTTSCPGYDRRLSLDEASNFQNPPRRLGLGASRHSLDEPATPSVEPSEIYAPSEVSVDWSVTTAEGFDRASVATYDEPSEVENFGGKTRRGGNGLLGCRCEKAVSVGPSPFKMGPHVIAPSMSGTRTYENRNGNGNRESNQNHVTAVNFNKPPIGMEVGGRGGTGRSQSHQRHQHHQHCHPARVSLAFAA